MSTRTNDFLAALRSDIVRVLVAQTGAPETQVMGMASQILSVTQERFAGEKVYIPAPQYDETAVLADFNGRNHDHVCCTHGISRRTLYRVIERSRT